MYPYGLALFLLQEGFSEERFLGRICAHVAISKTTGMCTPWALMNTPVSPPLSRLNLSNRNLNPGFTSSSCVWGEKLLSISGPPHL